MALLAGLLLAPLGAAAQAQRGPQAAAAEPTRAPKPAENAAAQNATDRIELVGVKSLNEADVRNALAEPAESIGREGVTPANADDAAFFAELFYRKRGFPRVSVAYAIVGGGRLRLTVSEGPAIKLGDVSFPGARRLPADKLREYFLGPTRSRVPKNAPQLPFVKQDLDGGAENLRSYYASEGFLDAVVAAPTLRPRRVAPAAPGTPPPPPVVDVRVSVREGVQYRYGPIAIVGLPPLSPKDLAPPRANFLREVILQQRVPDDSKPSLDRGLAEFSKEPFTPGGADAMAKRVEDWLKRRGHFTAKVSVEAPYRRYRNRGAVVPVRLVANPGPVWIVGDIRVSGTDRLNPQYVVNRFRKFQGKPYDPAGIDGVFQEEIRTGLFRGLSVKPQPDGTLRLDVDIKEGKAREVGFSLGYATYDGPLAGVELRDRNLFGLGRTGAIRLDYSARTIAGEILYEDRHFLETDWQFRTRLRINQRDLDSYTKEEVGGQFELSRKLSKELEVAGFVSIRKVKISELEVSPAEAGPTSYFVGSAGASVSLDLRDSPVIPMRGIAANASVEAAPGLLGDTDYVRSTWRLTYYLPLPKKFSLAVGIRQGSLVPLAGSRRDVPIDERFFSGGSTTVRSFAERELGPRDPLTDKFVGGLSYTTFNAELGIPIVGQLRGAVFFDAGNLSRSPTPTFSGLREAIGAGVRYQTPVGPLRVDYGINPSPKRGESSGALHISFGVAF